MQVASSGISANYAQLLAVGPSSKAKSGSDSAGLASSATGALSQTSAAKPPSASSAPLSLLASSTASALFQQTQADSAGTGVSQPANTTPDKATDSTSAAGPDGRPYAQPVSMTGAMGLPNLTDGDVSMVEAALGVKQVAIPAYPGGPVGPNSIVQLQNAAGQNLDNTATFAAFNNALLGISAAKTGGAISQRITAGNFDSIMSQAGINFATSESAAAKEWLMTNSESS